MSKNQPVFSVPTEPERQQIQRHQAPWWVVGVRGGRSGVKYKTENTILNESMLSEHCNLQLSCLISFLKASNQAYTTKQTTEESSFRESN